MPNEGYRKRLEEWELDQKKRREQEEADKPYDPKKMTSQAPLGCVILGAIFSLALIYTMGAMGGLWKRFLW